MKFLCHLRKRSVKEGNAGKGTKFFKYKQSAERATKVFKYKGNFYQEVTNFCNNYNGLKREARTELLNTKFTKSAYLVIPGHSKSNYERVPAEWKNGTQDLSLLKSAAYLLEKRTTKTGPRLLLVACEELRRKAVSYEELRRRARNEARVAQKRRARERSAQVLDR